MLQATLFFSSSIRPAPKVWLVRTEKPMAAPMAKPVTMNIRLPVEPTAAREPAPRNLPTIIVSTMLYNC